MAVRAGGLQGLREGIRCEGLAAAADQGRWLALLGELGAYGLRAGGLGWLLGALGGLAGGFLTGGVRRRAGCGLAGSADEGGR